MTGQDRCGPNQHLGYCAPLLTALDASGSLPIPRGSAPLPRTRRTDPLETETFICGRPVGLCRFLPSSLSGPYAILWCYDESTDRRLGCPRRDRRLLLDGGHRTQRGLRLRMIYPQICNRAQSHDLGNSPHRHWKRDWLVTRDQDPLHSRGTFTTALRSPAARLLPSTTSSSAGQSFAFLHLLSVAPSNFCY